MQSGKKITGIFTKIKDNRVSKCVQKCVNKLCVRGLRGIPLTSSKWSGGGTVLYYKMRILQKNIRGYAT